MSVLLGKKKASPWSLLVRMAIAQSAGKFKKGNRQEKRCRERGFPGKTAKERQSERRSSLVGVNRGYILKSVFRFDQGGKIGNDSTFPEGGKLSEVLGRGEKESARNSPLFGGGGKEKEGGDLQPSKKKGRSTGLGKGREGKPGGTLVLEKREKKCTGSAGKRDRRKRREGDGSGPRGPGTENRNDTSSFRREGERGRELKNRVFVRDKRGEERLLGDLPSSARQRRERENQFR